MVMPFDGSMLTIFDEFAMCRAGKLASRPDSLALYIASPQTWSSEIAVLLQEQPSPTFQWEVLSMNLFQNGPYLVNWFSMLSGMEEMK